MESYDNDQLEEIERNCILRHSDSIWQEQIQRMGLLRDAVRWRSYGQRNPLYEYQADAYRLFEELNIILRQLVLSDLIRTIIL